MMTQLEKLQAQKKELEKTIRKAKTIEQKKQAEVFSKKCRVVGAAVIAEMKTSETVTAQIDKLIDKHTKNKHERGMFGLEPLQKEENKKP